MVISTGAQYNRPEIDELKKFEGRGIYYGATYIEAQLCEREEVIVIGGGNSAGQAADVSLADREQAFTCWCAPGSCPETMSRYLIQRIQENPAHRIALLHGNCWRSKARATGTRHVAGQNYRRDLNRTTSATSSSWRGHHPAPSGSKAASRSTIRASFSQAAISIRSSAKNHWPLQRMPQMLETSLPGVFAVGDVSAGNVKRVASAVGEGSISINLVHRVLAEL